MSPATTDETRKERERGRNDYPHLRHALSKSPVPPAGTILPLKANVMENRTCQGQGTSLQKNESDWPAMTRKKFLDKSGTKADIPGLSRPQAGRHLHGAINRPETAGNRTEPTARQGFSFRGAPFLFFCVVVLVPRHRLPLGHSGGRAHRLKEKTPMRQRQRDGTE